MITDAMNDQLETIRQQAHPRCTVCSSENKQGLQLDFRVAGDNEIVADFIYEDSLEGYPGILHGGVIATILDGAMTNCLFAQRHTALTADFRIRFRHPVAVGIPARVRAWIIRSTPPIFEVKAEIIQDDQIATTSTAKFMERRESSMDRNP